MPFNRQSTRSRFVTSTAMPPRNGGNREETDLLTQLSISEQSSRAELKTFPPNSAQTTELMLQD